MTEREAPQDAPDTMAMLREAMGGDVLCNNTTGRYLSNHIEELIAVRVAAARKQALEEAAKACEARLGVMSMFGSRETASTHNNAIHECLGAIRSLTPSKGQP